jgi:hypothetical protein
MLDTLLSQAQAHAAKQGLGIRGLNPGGGTVASATADAAEGG